MRYRCEILNHGIDGYEVWLHGRNQGRSGVKIFSIVASGEGGRQNPTKDNYAHIKINKYCGVGGVYGGEGGIEGALKFYKR